MDIYAYDDFRLFLKECFEEKKRENPDFSHRKFMAAAGIKNPSLLNEVVKGTRKLSKAATERFLDALELRDNEADFFRLMVAYGQAKSPAEKHALYHQMGFRRSRSLFVRLNPAQEKYYRDWRYPLVRAAVEVFSFRGNYEELSRFIRPPLPVTVVKKCVRDLCEWGLVKQEGDGRYRVTHSFQEHPQSMGELIKRLNREWILQAADAIDQFTRDERHISSRLLTVDGETEGRIEAAIQRFRDEVYAIAKEQKGAPDRIWQLNIQFFPRSTKKGR